MGYRLLNLLHTPRGRVIFLPGKGDALGRFLADHPQERSPGTVHHYDNGLDHIVFPATLPDYLLRLNLADNRARPGCLLLGGGAVDPGGGVVDEPVSHAQDHCGCFGGSDDVVDRLPPTVGIGQKQGRHSRGRTLRRLTEDVIDVPIDKVTDQRAHHGRLLAPGIPLVRFVLVLGQNVRAGQVPSIKIL